jgi:hypothetical protein
MACGLRWEEDIARHCSERDVKLWETRVLHTMRGSAFYRLRGA